MDSIVELVNREATVPYDMQEASFIFSHYFKVRTGRDVFPMYLGVGDLNDFLIGVTYASYWLKDYYNGKRNC